MESGGYKGMERVGEITYDKRSEKKAITNIPHVLLYHSGHTQREETRTTLLRRPAKKCLFL